MGAQVFYVPTYATIDEAVGNATTVLKEKGPLKCDDVVVYVGSTPFQTRGRTNMLKLSK